MSEIFSAIQQKKYSADSALIQLFSRNEMAEIFSAFQQENEMAEILTVKLNMH